MINKQNGGIECFEGIAKMAHFGGSRNMGREM